MITRRLNFIILIMTIFIKLIKSDLVYFLIGGITDTSINIKAKTSETLAGKISIYLNNTIKNTFSGQEYYDMTVNGLTPNTNYAIGINYNGDKISTVNVQTFPIAGQSVDYNFVVGSYVYSKADTYIFDRMKTANPKFALILGSLFSDSVGSSESKDFQDAYLKGNFNKCNKFSFD
jgi:hypothetical protein